MFEKHKKVLEKAGYKVYTNKVTTPKGDVVASINPYGSLDTKDEAIRVILSQPVVVEKKKKKKKVSSFIEKES